MEISGRPWKSATRRYYVLRLFSQRFCAIRFGDTTSSFKQCETCVPQVIVISHILFNILFNNFADIVTSDGLTNVDLSINELLMWCSASENQAMLNVALNLTLKRLDGVLITASQ